jgi:hypothetical protein
MNRRGARLRAQKIRGVLMADSRITAIVLLLLLVAVTGCSDSTAAPAIATEAIAPAVELDGTATVSEVVQKDVPYVPTPHEVVARMLKMANVSRDDLLYDLGSGDGRIVVAAARDYGARGIGIDIDPERIAEANDNARRAGVTERVRFIQGDLFDTDLRPATVLTLYLLRSVNLRLRPKILDELRPGTPVVSHDFDMGEWEADDYVQLEGDSIYLWIVPAKVNGTWRWRDAGGNEQSVRLTQKFQKLEGDASVVGASLRGDWLALTIRRPGAVSTELYEGRVSGNSVRGTLTVDGVRSNWAAVRGK